MHTILKIMKFSTKDTPANVTTAFKKVELEELKSVGEAFYGLTLNVGDEIEFPAEKDMSYWLRANGSFKPSAYINVGLNGKLTAFPVGSLRKVPCDDYGPAFLAKYSVNKELADAPNDMERCVMLAGKKLRVKEATTDHAPVIVDRARVLNDDGSYKTKQSKYVIFEWI